MCIDVLGMRLTVLRNNLDVFWLVLGDDGVVSMILWFFFILEVGFQSEYVSEKSFL